MTTQAEKRRLQAEIEEARQRNALYRVPGTVRLQTQYHYRDARAPSKRWRRLPGFRNISVCSGAKKWKALSPLYVGPITLPDGSSAPTLDAAWNQAQVFREEQKETRAKRNRGKPLYWQWNGQRLDELAARRLYSRLYAENVVRSDAYCEIKVLVSEGFNLQLFGYDCYDHIEQGRSLLECMQDLDARYGHEFVLYGLLTKQHYWEQAPSS